MLGHGTSPNAAGQHQRHRCLRHEPLAQIQEVRLASERPTVRGRTGGGQALDAPPESSTRSTPAPASRVDDLRVLGLEHAALGVREDELRRDGEPRPHLSTHATDDVEQQPSSVRQRTAPGVAAFTRGERNCEST